MPSPSDGELTEAKLRAFWGPKSLSAYGESRLRALRSLKLRTSKRGPGKEVGTEHIKKLTDAWVLYNPAGSRYDNSYAKARVELPCEVEPVEDEEAAEATWWPVTWVEFSAEVYPAWLPETEGAVGAVPTVGTVVIWVVCVYQWMETEVWAWPCRLG
jgi:hypothetical protein